MTSAEIKTDLVKRINYLKKDKLKQLQGFLNNCENESIEFEDWINLSDYENKE